MIRILVTGASGFIGLHLVRRLTATATTSPAWCGSRRPSGRCSRLAPARSAATSPIWNRSAPGRSGRPANRLPIGRLSAGAAAGGIAAGQRRGAAIGRPGMRRRTRTARPRRRLLAGGRRPEPTRPAPPRNRPLPSGLGLRAEQAGRRTGGANVGRPRSHHHRAAADRFRRRRSRHAPRLSADLANRRPHGSRLGAPPFPLIHAADLVELLVLAAARGRCSCPPIPRRRTPRSGPPRGFTSPRAQRARPTANLGG